MVSLTFWSVLVSRNPTSGVPTPVSHAERSLQKSPGRAAPAASPSRALSDAQLVLAARDGAQWASEALYTRHAPMVLGLAHRLLGRADEVDDLVQDAFVAAFENLPRLRDPQAFASWVGGITVRTARKTIRRKRLRRKFGLERHHPLDTEELVSSQAPPDVGAELRAIYAMLETLDPDVRVALVLRRVEGLKLTEIASFMGISLATTKRRLNAGETALAARLSSPHSRIAGRRATDRKGTGRRTQDNQYGRGPE